MTLKNGPNDYLDNEHIGGLSTDYENYTEWLNAKEEDIHSSRLYFVNE